MALITDPDDLNQGTEITIDTTAKTITLNVAGNLSNDGVTGQALYSFIKEEWKNDANLIKYEPPFEQMITPEQFEWLNDWVPANDATRNLIRTAGWREITNAGAVEREYMGIISLGNIDSSDTPYYAFSSDTAKTDFDFSGPINQAIQTFGDSSNGNFDKRSDTLTLYIRAQGKTYGSATSTSIGLTALNYIANRFPLAEATDTNISASDSDITSNAPYTGMSITYGAVTRTIGGVSYNFNVVVDGNSGSTQQIYEFVQHKLRQATDIDDGAGTQVGQLEDSLMTFSGCNPDHGHRRIHRQLRSSRPQRFGLHRHKRHYAHVPVHRYRHDLFQRQPRQRHGRDLSDVFHQRIRDRLGYTRR